MTIVSVGHRAGLAAFHVHRLRLQAATDDGLTQPGGAVREPIT
ncbi:MAG TPA: hypothetical protein VL742_09465 [Casimicrobiaceae bacterium]|nr:hypothetical protein [Casimicrobiaceae bacterium]